ncbi:MAG: cobyrinate a,c-diamide synthase [Desulfobacterales bacterium]|nr:MAG: cobyrinate a,c-diamide synthase [Desulfobacterales bacterium]
MDFPRIVIAALRGGSGKTIVSIGIIAALTNLGKTIVPFKKGPDYIDAGWLAMAGGRPCYNLDTFLLEPETIRQSFLSHTQKGDIAFIEGNRGLYDGIDLEGRTSTAELAKLLNAPVILCVDCTKTTRTMAAVISGCLRFDPEVSIKGVILNQVAGSRHENILRESIQSYCGLPVLGAIPKLRKQNFPERHMGLVPTAEHEWARDSIAAVAQVAAQHLDLDAIVAIAREAPPWPPEGRGPGTADGSRKTEERIRPAPARVERPAPRIGILRDSAFQFYYPENIEALAARGAEIVFISPLADPSIPPLDALYIGGGFPETHAAALARNKGFRRELQARAEDGLPIYAECGGLMYLGEELVLEGKAFAMAGVLPVSFGFHQRPQGHGYTVATVERANPYYAIGTEIRGHEFHYSRVLRWAGHDRDLVFRMQRGVGIHKDKDGLLYKKVLATYTHVHALGCPAWAEALVRNAVAYQISKRK